MTPDQVLDMLAPLGDITARSMFGGHGLYWNDVIFGIRVRPPALPQGR